MYLWFVLPKKLQQKLDTRRAEHALRQLVTQHNLVDFSSNDYLGFSKSETIFNQVHKYLIDTNFIQNGATGSRLLSGNNDLYTKVESMLCEFHKSDAALVFNSGYDANIGFFSSVPQRNDIILYDELIHASIRDGMTMSPAKAYKFEHNNLIHLEQVLKRISTSLNVNDQQENSEIYVVTESVFSMDGDSPNLKLLTQFCNDNRLRLIVDEAHAVGVFGDCGVGLVQELKLQDEVFARIITFGKALGSHGAAILGSQSLKQYLVNFARSFIYTTGLPPHSLATILSSYNALKRKNGDAQQKLHGIINKFKFEINRLKIDQHFVKSNSAIHCCVVSGNASIKTIAKQLQKNNFDVKPILSPTVPKGQERLRFCLHSYNTSDEITNVLELLSTLL